MQDVFRHWPFENRNWFILPEFLRCSPAVERAGNGPPPMDRRRRRQRIFLYNFHVIPPAALPQTAPMVPAILRHLAFFWTVSQSSETAGFPRNRQRSPENLPHFLIHIPLPHALQSVPYTPLDRPPHPDFEEAFQFYRSEQTPQCQPFDFCWFLPNHRPFPRLTPPSTILHFV